MTLVNTAHYEFTALDAVGENTPMFFCADYDTCVVTLVSASNANATVKLYASSQEARPDLDNAASSINLYNTIGFEYLDAPGTVVDGDTGVAWSGTDATYQIVVDCKGARWIGLEMTARIAGSVTPQFDLYNKS